MIAVISGFAFCIAVIGGFRIESAIAALPDHVATDVEDVEKLGLLSDIDN